jgi:hypothetical protein
LYNAASFRPFTIPLAEGRQFPVEQRERIATFSSRRTLVVYQEDDTSNIIDLLLVTDLEIRKGERSKGRRPQPYQEPLMDWKCLDEQMQRWSSRLRDDLNIGPPESNRLATTIATEVAALPNTVKVRIRESSPIPLDARTEELVAFQAYMDMVHQSGQPHPSVIRAQAVYQNYVCFVYLNEACFKILWRELPVTSSARKCCKVLTDNPVRAFRNALAHANWRYLPDFSGLEFWARKGADSTEPIVRFEVSQADLSFWQTVARCTAYVAYQSL